MVTYEILSDQSLTIVRYAGTITFDQIVSTQRAYFADPSYVVGTPELAIFEDAEELDFDYQSINLLTTILTTAYKANGHTPTISILAPKDLPYGLSRVFQSVSEHRKSMNIMVHRTEKSALAWLGRNEASISELPR